MLFFVFAQQEWMVCIYVVLYTTLCFKSRVQGQTVIQNFFYI